MRIVGLTGRIGTGKSTVARWLTAYGAVAIDADALVAELYESDTALHAQLRQRFGDRVVREGRVDKQVLRGVFSDPGALADLERIVHPAVHRLREERLAAARTAGAPVAVIEAIRLVESGGSATCDELWIVVAGESVQIERLVRRGLDEAEARRRLASQGTPAGWIDQFVVESARLGRTRPVVIFDNSGSEAAGRAQADRLWRGLTAGAPRAAP